MKNLKSLSHFRWSLITLISVALLGIFGCSKSSDSGTTTSEASQSTEVIAEEGTTVEESASSSEEKKETTYSVGQTFTVGDVEYTVNSISTAATVGNEYLGETAQGIYILVNMAIKNNGKKALDVSDSFFNLYKGETEYKSDSTANLYASDNSGFFYDEINPGNTLTGTVVFDVPQDVAADPSLQLKVQTGFWGTQTARVNVNQ